MSNLKNTIEYEYENKLATTIPTKSSVTKIKQMKQKTLGVDIEDLTDNQEISTKEITFDKPKFLKNDEEQKITPSEKRNINTFMYAKIEF